MILWLFGGLPYFNSEQLYHRNVRDQSYALCVLTFRLLTEEKHSCRIFISCCRSKNQNSTELLVLLMYVYITLRICKILRNYLCGRKSCVVLKKC